MSVPGWSRLEDLFHRAAALPPSDRSAFLDSECAGDAALRADVESLLTHDAPPGAGIEDDIQREAEFIAAAAGEHLIGRRIGPYRVTAIIGEGGMGAVYRAVRDDDQYHKEVAVKLVRRGVETEMLLQRFRAERQILASLDHPYIARLLDGGATADGLPYFAMELIEGAPITRYASDRRLSIEARLELFQKVCEAVQYAHAKLTVHRDLKPANILITPDGFPKLLDFGIAKVLLSEDGLPEVGTTGTLRILTPGYASPEQVRGDSVTTATDVYSLGTVLYELLTGHLPHRIAGGTPEEMAYAVCSAEPAPPSESTELGNRSRLAGDLDNIVLMALRKEPERRYRSVEQLSEDLSRHLSRRPVIARADTLGYRAGKFMRRNRTAIVAAAAVVIALAGGMVMAMVQAGRAERRFQQVRRLANTVLFEIHDGIVNLAGSTAARRTIVRTSLEYLSSLSADARNDATLQAELAEAYLRVGDVQGNPLGASLGDAQGALESYRRAVELYSRAARARPNDFALQASLARAFVRLGNRQYSSADGAAAQRSFAQAGRLFDTVLARNSSDPAALEGAADASIGLSRVLVEQGDLRGATAQSSKAVDITRRLAAAEPSNPARRDALAGSLSQLGSCLLRTGELERLVDTYRSYVQLREQLVREDPENAARRRSLVIAYSRLGEVLGGHDTPNIGDVAGARIQFQSMLDIAESLAAADPANKTGQMDLAQAHFRMGGILIAGEPQAALAHLRKALDLIVQLAAADPDTIAIQSIRGAIEGNIGEILASQGQLAEGIVRMRRALTASHALADRQPTAVNHRISLLVAASNLAPALARFHNRAAVDALAVEVAPSLDWVHQARFSTYVQGRRPRTLFAFGQAYSLLKDQPEACNWFRRSVEAWRELESTSGIFPAYRTFQAAAIRRFEACSE